MLPDRSVFFAEFKLNPPADPALIEEFEIHTGFRLPTDYVDFLKGHNGGEGFIGENHLMLYRIEELEETQRSYEAATYAPGACFFGSNGGGEGFAFDFRSGQTSITMIPFVGSGWEDAISVGDTLDEFFEALFEDTLFDGRG